MVKGWPKDIKPGDLFVCPYCASRNGFIEFIPVKSGELVYDWNSDLAFHKTCGNHLALRVVHRDEQTGTFRVMGHIVPNLFATLDRFEEESTDKWLFLKIYSKFERGMEIVVDRVQMFLDEIRKEETKRRVEEQE